MATDNPVTPHADPAGHGPQAEYPVAGENIPALQAVATDKPVTPHADPAGHGAQAEFPLVGEYVPALQKMATDEPLGQADPAGQTRGSASSTLSAAGQ